MPNQMKNKTKYKTIAMTTIIILMGILLGVFTTSQYVRARDFSYIEERGYQIIRHQKIVEGNAGNPWQYRVLAPYLINGVLDLFKRIQIPNTIASSFFFFRILQDSLILLISIVYFRRLGISLPLALIGMMLLAWGMSYSHYDSDLSFNTFFDVIFYLLAGYCILRGKFVWIIPITILAAFNRETSGLIPFLPLAIAKFSLPKGSVRKMMPVFIASILCYGAIFIGLRLSYGEQILLTPYDHQPGLDLLWYNISRSITWENLVATLGIIPILALFGYSKWPVQLKVFFWVIVPIWIFIHAPAAVMAEGRHFLVPQAMVFIPGALIFAQQANASDTRD
jgi:hypothetical protein